MAQRTITYNADNMPVSINRSGTVTSILYDGNVARAKKTVGTTDTYYIGEDYEVDKQGTTTLQTRKYVFAGGTRVALIRKIGSGANTYFYFHKDHLGSSTVVTDATGAAASAEFTEYLPFGNERSHSGATVTNYKYTDQELDPETGLYNYGARLYDPIIGRFIGPDSAVQSPYDPQTLNRYAYCRNNPLIYVDPMGYGFFDSIGDVFEDVVKGIGNTVEGVLEGDVKTIATVAISVAAFYAAGAIIEAPWLQVLDPAWIDVGYTALEQAGIHAATGAFSGGVGAVINGGDVGAGMLTGGLSAGGAKFAGEFWGGSSAFSFSEFGGRMALGGAVGGISAELYGGNFGQGFLCGAQAAGYAYLFNDMGIGEGVCKAFSGVWSNRAVVLQAGTKVLKMAWQVTKTVGPMVAIDATSSAAFGRLGKVETFGQVGIKWIFSQTSNSLRVYGPLAPIDLTSYEIKANRISSELSKIANESWGIQ